MSVVIKKLEKKSFDFVSFNNETEVQNRLKSINVFNVKYDSN